MSIIHDALKKVQQSLTPKTNETPPAPSSEATQKNGSYLYENPSPVENQPPVDQKTTDEKPVVQNKIKSLLAFICAIVITTGALWYVYQQFKNDVPIAQRLAKKSFYTLVHKAGITGLATKAPDLKSLAQITIPTTATTASASQSPATGAAPTTLNIHGIMSNATGNLALINDQVYQEGDEVDGAKIIKIDLKSITVNINGTEKTIFVKS